MPSTMLEKSGCRLALNCAAIVALLGSTGAVEISVFHADDDGKGTNPLRLELIPRLIAPHCGAPLVEVTATVVEADLVGSCVEVAVTVTVAGGVPAGVKVPPVPEVTPDARLRVPLAVGARGRLTVLAKAPVPVTVGVQVAVWVEEIDDGVHAIETADTVGAPAVTAMLVVPEILMNPSTAE